MPLRLVQAAQLLPQAPARPWAHPACTEAQASSPPLVAAAAALEARHRGCGLPAILPPSSRVGVERGKGGGFRAGGGESRDTVAGPGGWWPLASAALPLWAHALVASTFGSTLAETRTFPFTRPSSVRCPHQCLQKRGQAASTIHPLPVYQPQTYRTSPPGDRPVHSCY